LKVYSTGDIGALVRKRRKEMRMTQSQLADVSGSGIRFVSELENGKQTMQLGKVINILLLLGLDVTIDERSA